jgi:hypothetical protein
MERMMYEVGQEYEMQCHDEAGVFWSRVRVVRDDGTSVWVRYADRIGNSFPVPREWLRPIINSA